MRHQSSAQRPATPCPQRLLPLLLLKRLLPLLLLLRLLLRVYAAMAACCPTDESCC